MAVFVLDRDRVDKSMILGLLIPWVYITNPEG